LTKGCRGLRHVEAQRSAAVLAELDSAEFGGVVVDVVAADAERIGEFPWAYEPRGAAQAASKPLSEAISDEIGQAL